MKRKFRPGYKMGRQRGGETEWGGNDLVATCTACMYTWRSMHCSLDNATHLFRHRVFACAAVHSLYCSLAYATCRYAYRSLTHTQRLSM